jgi:cysteine-rich repeat protein
MVVLSCIAFGVACDGGSPTAGAFGDTEVNLVISDPATAPEQFATLIDFVSYRITCPASSLTPYDDSVDLNGTFESDGNANPAVWTLVTDLPLSLCTITLWVFYEDEVICSGSEVLSIVEDDNPLAPNKANIVLECDLSVNGPSGDLDVDGSYEFIHGNYCPKLVWLGAIPFVVDATVPAVTTIETESFDPDGTCGLNCDPQTCDFTQNPPVCTAAPDPGLTSTLFAPAGNGAFGDPNALDTTYTCDPLFPGPTELCVVASDGDNDCDQIRCLTIVCPDLCEGVVCNDAEECTRDRCDPLTGLCSNDPAPDGIACNNCNNTCATGACTGVAFTADFVANDSTVFIASDLQSPYNPTFVNPYSGATKTVLGTFNVNNSTYLGIGTADVLSGITTTGTQNEILTIQDLVHPQTVCGIETITSLNGFDVLFLADDYIMLQGMVMEGGNTGDVLWSNAGDDTLRGKTGTDLLDGGPGNDIIEGGNGNDTVTLWPGSGFDSISGGDGIIDNAILDRVEIGAIQSQILISPAADLSYEFDIFYLGTPMAQIREVEFLDMNDASIDLTLCTGGPGDVCNLCGNDDLNGDEGCDDGNNVNGDGCAADCTAEY